MKLRIFIFATLLTMPLLVQTVSAQQSATSEQVANRCSLAQSYLKDIQKPRDLRARVDRLQAYRYIASRMDVFVRRLERNNQPKSRELRVTLNALETEINTFKARYESYDAAREDITKLKNCASQTAEFQAKLELARAKRSEVNSAVNSIEDVLNVTTKDQLTALYKELLATSKTAGDTNE